MMRTRLIWVILLLSSVGPLSQVQAATPAAPKGPYDASLISYRVLTPDMFGVASGQPVADVSVILLPNGKLRSYVFAQSKGIEIAESSDGGKTFSRVGNAFGGDKGNGQPRVVALSDGRFRMYNSSSDGISCSISSDGLSFTLEKSTCISSLDYSEPISLSGPAIVQLSSGKWKAYFSGLPCPSKHIAPCPFKIYSASSDDGVTWTKDSGVRIGNGSSKIVRSAEHPSAIRSSDNSITLFYFDNGSDPEGSGKVYENGNGLYYAQSSDGINFSDEKWFDMPKVDSKLKSTEMNDPDVVLDKNGNLLLFGGGFDHNFGGYINSMELRPGKGTPPFSGERCLNPKFKPGDPPFPPCGNNQPTQPQAPTQPSKGDAQPAKKPVSVAPTPVAKKTTITCVNGKVTKKVTDIKPVCPKGFKKK